MWKNDTIECSRVFFREITHTSNEFNQINVKLLISIQTLIFQFSHSPPLLTQSLGDLCFFISTVEPRFNEVAGDRPNLFVKSRVRYIENLDITNFRGNDQKVRYIEVIVNDWFLTQVTSHTQFNAVFVFWDEIHLGDLQCQLFSLLRRRSAFLYGISLVFKTRRTNLCGSDW